jgi:Neutral/alkaline non-lysosomal ceramidase, N-terminal
MTRPVLATMAALLLALAAAPAAKAGQIKAGVATVDATWHVGASAGQYATTKADGGDPFHEFDPHGHQLKNAPSYGVQSRLEVRALVVQGPDGTKVALVKNDLYIPQDLLWRRAAQLIEAKNLGIDREHFTMAVTHNHSSPYYTSTSWGAWAFQDVFDIRMFNYYAARMAEAVAEANERLVPARIGAGVTQVALSNRNALGPALADDGSPAGFPDSYTDRDLAVIRVDDVSAKKAAPLATLVNWAQHPEDLEGNDLISADYVGPLERMVDRETGGRLVFTQGSVGTTEPERSSYHSVHDRLDFTHREYGQAEYNARLVADAITRVHDDIGRGRGRVPFFTDGEVAMESRWFPGPLTHPYPAVSNCRTEQVAEGNPQLPVVGLPDCAGPSRAFDEVGADFPETPQSPGPSHQDLKEAGIPVPDNYGAPSYSGLEEDVSVHLQAFRIGDILFTVCSCEQWADQSKNIKTRTDKVIDNAWRGFDWSTYTGLNGLDQACFRLGSGDWSCPDPTKACELKGAGFTNTCRGAPFDARVEITDEEYRRMRAQVNHCANGWNSPEFAPYAESEPPAIEDIKGNFTCDDDDPRSAALGYALTVPIGMGNDYNGYIASYREYQRGDHYRKALTGWGPHSSDYMATRLVQMGRHLNGGPDVGRLLDDSPDPDGDNPVLMQKAVADLALNDARARALGEGGTAAIRAYEATLPRDGGSAGAVEQPEDVERFGGAFFEWVGGSNYTDDPVVRVQRRVGMRWEDYADQTGEVVTTLKFPAAQETPAYASGTYTWRWTAHFEAFVSRYDLGGERPRATPAGTYRFVVFGKRREAGGLVRPYQLVSDEFAVRPWDGITAGDLRSEPDGTVSLQVGPRGTVTAYSNLDKDNPVEGVALGPIDYPDSYSSTARFIRDIKTYVRDPAAPDDTSRFELYCLACSWRPWLDVGDASSVTVTLAGPDGARRVTARRAGDRWVTEATLRDGEAPSVCPGDVRDAYGNFNAEGAGPQEACRRQ